MIAVAEMLDRIVVAVARWARWLVLPLIGVIIFDILTRKFVWTQQLIANSAAFKYMSSGHLQDWEWHLHTVLFLMALGYTYVRNGHVRVDLFRDKLGPRTKAWIELLGCAVFLVPYAVLLLYFAWPFVLASWTYDEQSTAFTGLGHRWAIKSFLLLGFALVLMAGVSRALRSMAYLFGADPERAARGLFDSPAVDDPMTNRTGNRPGQG